MQKDRTDEPEESQKSRPSSRRSSVSLPRKNSLKSDKDKKILSPAHSAQSTPKRNARPSLDFIVTGKQILKRSDRANSLPGSSRGGARAQRASEANRAPDLDDDLSLDLSQVSDFEDGMSRYGKVPLATSTPNPVEETQHEVRSPQDGRQKSSPQNGRQGSSPQENNQRSTPLDGNQRYIPQDGNQRSIIQECRITSQSGTPKATQNGSHRAAIQDGYRSAPSQRPHKPRSASLQHLQQRVERRTTTQQSVDSPRRSQRSVDLPSGRGQSDLPSGRSQQSDLQFGRGQSDLQSGRSQQSDLQSGRGQSDLPPGRSQQSDLPSSRSQQSDLQSGRGYSDLQSGRGQKSDLPSGRSQSKPSRDSTFSCSRDSLYKTSSSASPYRNNTDYSSVSPEYSQSSTELSPREPSPVLSSCCSHSWAEHTMACGGCGGGGFGGGEWSRFWADYSCARPGYDRCPTPYREVDCTDFEFAERRARSPSEGIRHINNIIKSEGLRLSPRDAQRVIHCAHLLGSVLSRAVERAHTPTTCQPNERKHTLTLNLKASELPSEQPREPKQSETVTTQTDISLPNTKSAPRIFENILRQLSRSSIDEPNVVKLDKVEKVEKVEKDEAK